MSLRDATLQGTNLDFFVLGRTVRSSQLLRHSMVTFHLGLGLFHGNYVESIELPVREAVLLGDAFAFGAVKYGGVGGWRNVSQGHHLRSAGGHFDKWLTDCDAIDTDSQLPHEGLFLARAMMLLELRGAK